MCMTHGSRTWGGRSRETTVESRKKEMEGSEGRHQAVSYVEPIYVTSSYSG